MKKLYKILGSVLICFSVMFGNFTVFAASPTCQWSLEKVFNYDSGNTSYGSFLAGFHFNAVDVVNGYVYLDFSSLGSIATNLLDALDWFSDGCRFTYNDSNHRLYVYFDDVQFCSVYGYKLGNQTSSGTYWEDAKLSNHLSLSDSDTVDYTSKLDSIISEFGTLNGYTESVASDLDTIKLYLVDMMGDVGDINTSMSSVLSYLSSVNSSVSTLKTLATTNNATLTSILNTLISVGDDVSSINDNVSSISDDVQSIYSQVTDLLTSLNNIDDTLDTISWNVLDNAPYGWKSPTTDINADMSSLTASYSYPEFIFRYNYYVRDEGIYKITVNYDSMNNYDTPKLYFNYNGTSEEIDILYYSFSRYHLNVYFSLDGITLPYTSPHYFSLKVKQGRLFTSGNFSYLSQADIEYWQLLQYFNQYKSNLEIISLLQDLNGFTDGSVDDSSFSSDDSTFDSTFNDYHDTTDSIFDTFEDSVSNLDLTDSAFSISDSVYQGLSFISYNLTRIVTNTSSISVIFYLPLLLGVIMLFLGIRR